MKKYIFKIFLFSILISKTGLSFSQTFKEETVQFANTEHHFLLSGTLTIPSHTQNFPMAVLISGSGQTDRDETIMDKKLFKGLAENLSQKGIAVLRYDDRGGFESKGPKVSESVSADLVQDALSAVTYLKSRFPGHKIGLIGHSEGGGLAAMAADQDPSLHFIVSLAGLVVSGKEVLIKQNHDIFRKSGADSLEVQHYIQDFFEPVIGHIIKDESYEQKLFHIQQIGKEYVENRKDAPFGLKMNADPNNAKIFLGQMNNPWFIDFMKTEPLNQWKNVNCPALAINGTLDIQVDAELNLNQLQALNKSNITIKKLAKHNHLFQIAQKGTLDEYATIKTGMSDELINIVAEFINKL